jgi:3,4-dihydroxy-2-butanone 4-phosphate synthase
MAKHGRGLICLTLTDERCKQLGLRQMVADNQTPYSTAFTVSIEAAEGVTTGISAADRATTIQAAVAKHAKGHRHHPAWAIFSRCARSRAAC